MKNIKGVIVYLLLFAVGVVGGYFTKQFITKDNIDEIKNVEENSSSDDNVLISKNEKIYIEDGSDNLKTLSIDIDGIGGQASKLLLNDIKSYYKFSKGYDTVYGSTYYLFLLDNKTIASLEIDSYMIEGYLNIKTNVGQLTNVIDIKIDESKNKENEVQFSKAYAILEDGSKVDITNKI